MKKINLFTFTVVCNTPEHDKIIAELTETTKEYHGKEIVWFGTERVTVNVVEESYEEALKKVRENFDITNHKDALRFDGKSIVLVDDSMFVNKPETPNEEAMDFLRGLISKPEEKSDDRVE